MGSGNFIPRRRASRVAQTTVRITLKRAARMSDARLDEVVLKLADMGVDSLRVWAYHEELDLDFPWLSWGQTERLIAAGRRHGLRIRLTVAASIMSRQWWATNRKNALPVDHLGGSPPIRYGDVTGASPSFWHGPAEQEKLWLLTRLADYGILDAADHVLIGPGRYNEYCFPGTGARLRKGAGYYCWEPAARRAWLETGGTLRELALVTRNPRQADRDLREKWIGWYLEKGGHYERLLHHLRSLLRPDQKIDTFVGANYDAEYPVGGHDGWIERFVETGVGGWPIAKGADGLEMLRALAGDGLIDEVVWAGITWASNPHGHIENMAETCDAFGRMPLHVQIPALTTTRDGVRRVNYPDRMMAIARQAGAVGWWDKYDHMLIRRADPETGERIGPRWEQGLREVE